jgi:hypothetical protein
MTDSDDLYAGMDVDDDLSTALRTETFADRDMIPAGLKIPLPRRLSQQMPCR